MVSEKCLEFFVSVENDKRFENSKVVLESGLTQKVGPKGYRPGPHYKNQKTRIEGGL